MNIKAERVPAGDLKPGDLFSFYGPEYWRWVRDVIDPANPAGLIQVSVGERVYIAASTCYVRGTMSTPPGDEAIEVTRLEIER